MSRLLALLLVLASTFVVGVLTWLGLRQDPVSLAENLVADVLVAAVLTVAIQAWLTRRARRSHAAQLTTSLDHAIVWAKPLSEHFEQVGAWASQRWAGEVDILDVRPRGIFVPFTTQETFVSELEWLSAEYGIFDLAPLYARILRKQGAVKLAIDEVMRQLKGLDARPDPYNLDWNFSAAGLQRVNEAMAKAETALAPVLTDVRLLLGVLQHGYPPTEVARRRIALPLPRWMIISTFALAGIAAGIWVAAAVASSLFPNGFAEAVGGNVLSGCVAASFATALTSISAYVRSKTIFELAVGPYSRLMQATSAIWAVFDGQFPEKREELLREIAWMVHDNVNQLEHVRPDAKLHRYAELLGRTVEEFAGGVFKAHQDVDADVLTRLGLVGQHVPTPQAMRLMDLASRLHGRAYETYIRNGRPIRHRFTLAGPRFNNPMRIDYGSPKTGPSAEHGRSHC